MKFSMEYEVNSKTYIANQINIHNGDRTYIFHPNEQGMLAKLQIIADVPHQERFYSKIHHNPDEEIKTTITLNTDKDLFDSVVEEFRELESLLSLQHNLKSIDWQTQKHEVICETEEEKIKTKIYGLETGRAYPDDPVAADEDSLQTIIDTKDRYASLTIPLSFNREGKNDYIALKYINAFFHFYFILEGMYGNGKTKNIHIVQEFKKSDELKSHLKITIKEFIKPIPQHYKRVEEMLKAKNLTFSLDDLLELIVMTRGELHHFNIKKPLNTPFKHEDYQTICFITRDLALRAIWARIVDINQQYLNKNKT
jgi:hypothetical protein